MKYDGCLSAAMQERANAFATEVGSISLRDEIVLARLVAASMISLYDRVVAGDTKSQGYMASLIATSTLVQDALNCVKGLIVAEKQHRVDGGDLLPADVVIGLMESLEADVRQAIHPPGARPLGHSPELPERIVEIFSERLMEVVSGDQKLGTDITPDQMVQAMDVTIGQKQITNQVG